MDATPQLLVMAEISLHGFDAMWTLVKTPEVAPEGEVFHVLSSLALAARLNFVSLQCSYHEDDQPRAALACRNLLELAVFTKFVLKSRLHLVEFASDRLLDGLDIAQKLKAIELELTPEAASSILDASIAEFEKQMANEGVTRPKFLRTDDIAKVVGMESDYANLNKVCSKFVHPTSWSLLTSDRSAERFPFACKLFLSQGVLLFATIYAAMKAHLVRPRLAYEGEA